MRLYTQYDIELALDGDTWIVEVPHQEDLMADGKSPGDALRALAELFDQMFDADGTELSEDD